MIRPGNRTADRPRKFLPFGIKLLISYILLIIIPIFIFGYIANSILVDSIRNQTTANIKGTLRQIADNIRYKLEDTQRISDLLYHDDALSKRIMHYEEGWASYEATTKYLLPKFHQTIDSTNRNVWLTIYLKNETLPEIYYHFGTADPLSVRGRFFEVLHLKRIEEKGWYTSFPQEQYGKTVQWAQVDDDGKYGRISLLRRLVDTSSPTSLKEIGFIRISVYLSDLFESVDFHKIGSGSTITVVDDKHSLMYASGKAIAASDGNLPHIRENGYLLIEEKLPALQSGLAATIPTDVLEENTKKVNRLTLVICVLCCAAIALVALIVSRLFSRRVSKLVSVLQSFRRGNFDRRIHYSGNDEFTIISHALNELGENTQKLIQEVYVTKLKKKEAELETLQAQINPHFLYNTLSSISRLAKFGQVEQQHRMVMNLAKFYRLSLSDGHTVIPLYRELELTQAYADIQQIKYGDRFRIEYDIDPDILKFTTIKLILQPFIENVLEHAWCGDRIHIRIVGRFRQRSILLRIIDDGVGMSSQVIAGIFADTGGPRTGYGVRNVNDRIRLYFGDAYGVTISSRPGIGTSVQIEIPAQR